MNFKKITESDSNHNDLELKSTKEIVEIINNEDYTVAKAVNKILPDLTILIDLKAKIAIGSSVHPKIIFLHFFLIK